MTARRRLCSMAVHRWAACLGQPSAYPCAASAWSTIARIDYRLQGMGARVFGRATAVLRSAGRGCRLAP